MRIRAMATALMASRHEDAQPASLVLMGGPIDTRRNPTKVNDLAAAKPLSWFERNVILTVPFPHAGFMRPVYPGFMQLTGFMTMNLERHMNAHVELFNNLVKGDCDSVRQHRGFYEEYLSVMDLTPEALGQFDERLAGLTASEPAVPAPRPAAQARTGSARRATGRDAGVAGTRAMLVGLLAEKLGLGK